MIFDHIAKFGIIIQVSVNNEYGEDIGLSIYDTTRAIAYVYSRTSGVMDIDMGKIRTQVIIGKLGMCIGHWGSGILVKKNM